MCHLDGGTLVSLETKGEWQFLRMLIQNITSPPLDEWYIGLKQAGNGQWLWASGEPAVNISHLWQPSEPSGDGLCVVMAKEWPPGTTGKFNDISCATRKGFICEITLDTTGASSKEPSFVTCNVPGTSKSFAICVY